MSIFDVDACEEKIGYVFKDKMLLRKCFTHSSYANEHGEEDNEILEFFGDAILEFVVTDFLYFNRGGNEGELTALRAKTVSKEPLLNIILELGLDGYMLLGKGLKNNFNKDEKLFSSLYEAIVAGIYIDGGLNNAKKFIERTLIEDFIDKDNKRKSEERKNSKNGKDGKSAFQEYVQKNRMGTISYETLGKKGPEHMPQYRMAVLLNGKRMAEGVGGSKKAGEEQAALRALEKLTDDKQNRTKQKCAKRNFSKRS